MQTTMPPHQADHDRFDGYGTTTLRRTRRRRRRATAVVLAFVLALGGVGYAFGDALHLPYLSKDHHQYLSADGWPAAGQGAYAFDSGEVHAKAEQQPVPIASVAKVMTAYLVVRAHPLRTGQQGPSFTVYAEDVADTERRKANDESLVEVEKGEVLTERQALEALLLPSANNVAVMLADWVSGSVTDFVDLMNRTAGKLGMDDTDYTDPSGFDPGTVSTAIDQLKLARAVVRIPVLNELMAMPSAHLPVAGVVKNTDTLLGQDGFVGMKTGSTDAAGGCFMFHVVRQVNGHRIELIGVVLGQPPQPGRPGAEAGLNAARQLADRVLTG